MPLLAGFIGSLFTGLVTWLSTVVAKRIAVITAGIAVLVAITSAMFAAVYGLLSTISYVVPDFLIVASSWIVPDNAVACITIYLSARILRWVYDWNTRIIQLQMAL